MCGRICTDTLYDPSCYTLMLRTHPVKLVTDLPKKHSNYKKSDLQYVCHLNSQDFSESFLVHLGTCDTFIAGTCSPKAVAESLFVDCKCLLQQNTNLLLILQLNLQKQIKAKARSSTDIQRALNYLYKVS